MKIKINELDNYMDIWGFKVNTIMNVSEYDETFYLYRVCMMDFLIDKSKVSIVNEIVYKEKNDKLVTFCPNKLKTCKVGSWNCTGCENYISIDEDVKIVQCTYITYDKIQKGGSPICS